MKPTTLFIHGGRLIDPASQFDDRADLLIEEGRVAAILPPGERSPQDNELAWDATGLIVAPGLIDVHVAFREPGDE